MNNLDIELGIKTTKGAIAPTALEGVTWTTERRGVPGKLTFKCLFDGNNIFEEGDLVTVKYKGQKVFYGFIFTISRDKDKVLSVTAYDQLRYLKNRDVYEYRNKKASEVITMLANDFQLQLGEIEDTKFIIPKRLEDGVSLFDIILTALGITLQNTKKMYVLYDDFGKLTLKNIENMKLDFIVNASMSQNFSYKSSIENSANTVKIVKSDSKAGKREIYIAKDSSNINKWGVLQHYDTLGEKENGKMKADALLQLHNRKFKSLDIKNVFGDIRVRAGSSIIVVLDLGDIKVSNYMLVESAKHIFNNQEYLMNLTVRGADIQ